MAGLLRKLACIKLSRSLNSKRQEKRLANRFRRSLIEPLDRRDLLTAAADFFSLDTSTSLPETLVENYVASVPASQELSVTSRGLVDTAERSVLMQNASWQPELQGEVVGAPLNLGISANVVGRKLFYNRSVSSVFGNGTGNPVNAIDHSKAALLPGEAASFVNYSNYASGINGLVVDIDTSISAISASDFSFAIWNGISSSGFQPLYVTPSISVYSGGGLAGSNRVKIEFPDNSIRNTWLRVTVLANLNTGLMTPDIFYFGNAVGDMNVGNSGSPPTIRTNAMDTLMVIQHQSIAANSISISSIFDVNKDGRVNATDTSIVRQNELLSSIRVFTAPSSINHPPRGSNYTASIQEDEIYHFDQNDFGFSDPNDSPAHDFKAVTITSLPNAQQGKLLLSGNPVSVGQTIVVTDLPRFSFQPAVNLSGDSLGFFGFKVMDDGPISLDGNENIDTYPKLFSFRIMPVADSPAIAPLNDLTILEDSASVEIPFEIADPDTPLDEIEISFSSSNEELFPKAALTWERSGNGWVLLTAPTPNRSGNTVLSISADDGTFSTTQSFLVTVLPVNDAPSSENVRRTINEEQPYDFETSDFSFSDTNDTPANLSSGILIAGIAAPEFGQLTRSGLPVSIGEYVSKEQLVNLRFTPAVDFHHANWNAFLFQVQDDGGVFNGGQNTDAHDRTFSFEILDVNDKPSLSEFANVELNEDSVSPPITFLVNDPDTAISQLVIVSTSSNPSLIDNHGILLAKSGEFYELRLSPKANQAGTSTIAVAVSDGIATEARSFTLTVLPVNDPPSGISSTRLVIEDQVYTFQAEDFGFQDESDFPPHEFSGVFIESVPPSAEGSLLVGQAVVTAGAFIAITDINQLKFIPARDQSGQKNTSITYYVQDDGGTAKGGRNRDPTLRTMTFEVRPVNDPPIAVDVLNRELRRGYRYHFSPSDFGFDDHRDLPPHSLFEVILEELPHASDGKLQLAGRDVVVSQSIPASHLINLSFTPQSTVVGRDIGSFRFRVRDHGGISNGGMNLSENAATFSFRIIEASAETSGRVEILADATVRTIYDSAHDSYFAGRIYQADEGIPAAWFANQGNLETLTSNLSQFASLVYLKLDLSGIDPGFTSITLNLHAIESRALNDATTSDAIQIASIVSSQWQESAIVDENSPAIGREIARWHVPIDITDPRWFAIELTSTIKESMARGEDSLSLVIHSSNESASEEPPMAEVVYTSRESEMVESRPFLAVRYPTAAAPVTAPASITLNEDSKHTFSISDFPYPPSNFGLLRGLVIRSLPNIGRMAILDEANPLQPIAAPSYRSVGLGQLVDRSVIEAGRLVFIPPGEASGRQLASFEFSVVDAAMLESAAATMLIDVLADDSMTILPLDSLVSKSGTILFGSQYDDGTGRSISNAGDVNRDGFDDLLIGAPYAMVVGDRETGGLIADDIRWQAGLAYLVYGGSSLPPQIDLSKLGPAGVVISGGKGYENAGRSVSGGGDLNGDGYADILVGGQGGNSTSVGPGISYVIFGGPALPQTLALNSLGSGGVTFYGRDIGDESGFSLDFAGDVNGDGIDDLAIGAYRSAGFADERPLAGETYILFGRTSLPQAIHLKDHGSIDVTIYGEDWGDESGFSVSRAGDVNGDGLDDLLIGARMASPEALGMRDTYGQLALVVPDIGGAAISDHSTFSIAYIIDSQPVTQVFEFDNNATGGTHETNYLISNYVDESPDDLAARIGNAIHDAFFKLGLDIQPTPRQNGRLDLYLYAPQIDIGGAPALRTEHRFLPAYARQRTDGASYLIYGHQSLPDVIELEKLGEKGVKIYGDLVEPSTNTEGEASTIQFGSSVSAAGDVNGDGYDDILIGAPEHGSFSGAALLIFGSKRLPQHLDRHALLHLGTGGMFLYGDQHADGTGFSVSGAGDINADGYADIVVGVPYADLYDPSSPARKSPYFPDIIPDHNRDLYNNGRSYVIFGSPHLPAAYSLRDLFALGDDGSIQPVQSLSGITPHVLMLTGSDNGTGIGFSLSDAGDVDGDGYDDLLIGAPFAKPRGLNSGQVHVLFGNAYTRLNTLEGTRENDNDLVETELSNIVVGGRGDDSLTGLTSNAVLRGGEGNDVFTIHHPEFRQINGGTGNDRLVLMGTGQLLDLTTLADNRLQGIEEIDIQGNRLRLSLREVIQISKESNTLIVHGSNGDTEIGPGWTRQLNETIASNTYHVFTQGIATLKVQQAISPIYNSPPTGRERTQSLATYLSTFQFSIGDFGFHDDFDKPANTLAGIEIISLPRPDEGRLFLDFTSVSVGQVIHATQIHKLLFVPEANAIGRNVGQFTFKVIDDGGLGIPVPIVNDSFEFPILMIDGEANNTEIPGWQLDSIAGAFNPITAIYNGANTTDGQQLAFAANGSLTQQLASVLTVNTRYQLQADVGARLDKTNTAYRVALYAGTHILAEANELQFNPVSGGFVRVTLDYLSEIDDTLVGQPLKIVLSSYGDQINFDRIRLSSASALSLASDKDREARNFSFDIGINRPPRGYDITKPIQEDQAYAIALSDFGFDDSQDNSFDELKGIYIDSLPLPVDGALRFFGATITSPAWIPANQLSGLVFWPAENRAGRNLGAFTFRLQDDGGVQNGGQDTDPIARTFAFDIEQINDPPKVGTIHDITTLEDTISSSVEITLTDVELPSDLLSVRFESSNPHLLRNEDITLTRRASSNRLTVFPRRNQSGTAIVTMIVSDGLSVPVNTSFTVTVLPVNDPPTTRTFERIAYRGQPLRLLWSDFEFSDVDESTVQEVIFTGTYTASLSVSPQPTNLPETTELPGLRLGSQPLLVNQRLSRNSIEIIMDTIDEGLFYDPPIDEHGSHLPEFVTFTFRAFDGSQLSSTSMLIIRVEDSPPASLPISIRHIGLLRPYDIDPDLDGPGNLPIDPISSINPTVAGWIQGNLDHNRTATIEFFHGDAILTNPQTMPDGHVVISASNGPFVYDPRITDPSLNSFHGPVTLFYRLTHTEAALPLELKSLSFYKRPPPTSGAYRLRDQLSPDRPLAYTTIQGSATPQEGILRGKVDRQISPQESGLESPSFGDLSRPIKIDIALDDSYEVYQSFLTDPTGQFNLKIPALPVDQSFLFVRIQEWHEEFGGYLESPFNRFELTPITPIAPRILSLAPERILDALADPPTTDDAILVGRVAWSPDTPRPRVAKWSADNGTTWSISAIDDTGSFRFAVNPNAFGITTIVAKASSFNPYSSADIESNWAISNFRYVPPSWPVISTFKLLNDTQDPSDGVTNDATLVGTLDGFVASQVLRVEFDIDNDDQPDAEAIPGSNGHFTYLPAIPFNQDTIVRSRLKRWSIDRGEFEVTAWPSTLLPPTGEPWPAVLVHLLPPNNPDLTISELSLFGARSESVQIPAVSRPVIQGRVLNSPNARIRWDQNSDAIWDGEMQADADGYFTFESVGLSPNRHTITVQALTYEPLDRTILYGITASIQFELVLTMNQPPVITELKLLSDSGIDGDGRTRNPGLLGRVMNDGDLANLPVAIDLDLDGFADATVFTASDGTFQYTPTLSTYGTKTIKAQVQEYDLDSHSVIFSTWRSLTFILDDQADTAPIIRDLVFDDFARDSNTYTQTPTLRGRITNEGSLAGHSIELDQDMDGTADYSVLTDDRGFFSIILANLPENSSSMGVRARETSELNRQTLVSPWSFKEVEHHSQSMIAPVPASIELVNDDGTSASDNRTSDPRLRGVVIGREFATSIRIQLDLDGDLVPDDISSVSSDGSWSFVPFGLSPGDRTVHVRTQAVMPMQNMLYSQWIPFTFHLLATSNEAVSIDSIGLLHDTGSSPNDRATSISTVTGRVVSGEPGRSVTIAFDHDGDGIEDGFVSTLDGSFIYTPSDLADGNWISLQARPRFTDTDASGRWSSFNFVLSQAPDSASSQSTLNRLLAFERSKAATIEAGRVARQVRIDEDRNGESQRNETVNRAHTIRNVTMNEAERAFQEAEHQANLDRQEAIDAASAAFFNLMQDFKGNSQSFVFNPLTLSAAPAVGILSIPSETSLPLAPRKTPTYKTPDNLDQEIDIEAKNAAKRLEDAFQAFASQQSDQRRISDTITINRYSQWIEDSTALREQDLQRAQAEFDQSHLIEPSNKLEKALIEADNLYRIAMMEADVLLAEVNQSFRDFERQIFGSEDGGIASFFDDRYLNTILPAFENWVGPSASAIDENTDPNLDAQLRLANSLAHLAATKGLDADHAQFVQMHMAIWWGRYRLQQDALRNIEDKRSLAQVSLTETRRKAYADAMNELQPGVIAARKAFEVSKASSEKRHQERVAMAVKIRDTELALHAKTERLAVEAGRSKLWRDLAAVKRDSAAARAAILNTPWARYQNQLAENEYNYTLAIAPDPLSIPSGTNSPKFHDEFWRLDAQGQEVRDLAIIESAYTRDLEVAHRIFEAFVGNPASLTITEGKIDSLESYWRSLSDESLDLEIDQIAINAILDRAEIQALSEIQRSTFDSAISFNERTNDLSTQIALNRLEALDIYNIQHHITLGASTINREHYRISNALHIDHSILPTWTNAWRYDESIRTAWLSYVKETSQREAEYATKIADALKDHRTQTAILDWELAKGIADAKRRSEKRAAETSLLYVEAVSAPNEKILADYQALMSGNRTVADAIAWKSYLQEEAQAYRDAMTQWSNSFANSLPGSRESIYRLWAEYHAELGNIEYAWAIDAGNAAVTHSENMRTSRDDLERAGTLAEMNLRINKEKSELNFRVALADARYAFIADPTHYLFAIQQATDSHTNALVTIDDQKLNRDNLFVESSSRYETYLALRRDTKIAEDESNSEYQLAVQLNAEDVIEQSSLGPMNTIVYAGLKNLFPDWADNGVTPEQVAGFRAIERQANESAFQHYHDTANSLQRDFLITRSNMEKLWRKNDSLAPLTEQLNRTHAELVFIEDSHATNQLYAEGDANRSRHLVNALYDARVNRDKAVLQSELDYAQEMLIAKQRFDVATTTAETSRTRATYALDAQRRQSQVSARGAFEVAFYLVDRDRKLAIAQTSPSTLATLQYQIAAAQAIKADANRTSRNRWEAEVSRIELSKIDQTNQATLDRSHALERAELDFEYHSRPFRASYGNAVIDANADYSEIHELAEIERMKTETLIENDWLHARKFTEYAFLQTNAAIAEVFADKNAEAHQQAALLREPLDSISMVIARDAYNDDLVAARRLYAQALETTVDQRVDELGNAKVAMANARGTASVELALRNQSILRSYLADITPLRKARDLAVAMANKTFSKSSLEIEAGIGSAHGLGWERESANIQQKVDDGLANTVFVSAVAEAEMNFWISEALAERVRTQHTANANPTNAQSQYDAIYSAAKHLWLMGLKNQYLIQQGNHSDADAALATDLAIAHRGLVEARLKAEQAFHDLQANKIFQLHSEQLDEDANRDSDLSELSLQRWVDLATYDRQYEIDVAMAQSSLAIDQAQVESSFQQQILETLLHEPLLVADDNTRTGRNFLRPVQELIEDGFVLEKVYRSIELERILNKHETAILDAKRKWLKADNAARLHFTNGNETVGNTTSPLRMGETRIEMQFANAKADRERIHSIEMANLAETRDRSLTAAQIAAWNDEAEAKSRHRLSKAIADLDFWSSAEDQRYSAHAAIDRQFRTPWSEYLVHAAQARQTALQLVRPDYLAMIADRNESESRYQLARSNAFEIREEGLADVRKTLAIETAVSSSRFAKETTLAQSHYELSVSPQAKAFADALVDDPKASPDDYYSSEAAASVARHKAIALAQSTLSTASTAADAASELAKVRLQSDYRQAESKAYAESIGRWSNLDRVFTLQHAQALLTTTVQTAQSYPSPWSYYDALLISAEYSHARRVSFEKELRSRALADAQAISERGLASADAIKQASSIDARMRQANTQTRVNQDLAIARADLGHALALQGLYRINYPNLADAAEIVSDYKMDPSPIFSFYRSVKAPLNLTDLNTKNEWALRPEKWYDSNEHIWQLDASTFDAKDGSYVALDGDGLRSFTKNPLYSRQAYAWWDYANSQHWIDVSIAASGQPIRHAGQFQLTLPIELVSAEFWNLDERGEEIVSTSHPIPIHALDPSKMIAKQPADSLVAKGQPPQWPFSMTDLAEIVTEIPKLITIDEIARQLFSFNESLAAFLLKNAAILESPAAIRPKNALSDAAVSQIFPGQLALVNDADRRHNPLNHESQFVFTFDANTQNPYVEAIRLESELTIPENAHSVAVRESFQQHIDERTPGFNARNEISRFAGGQQSLFDTDFIRLKGQDVYWTSKRLDRASVLSYYISGTTLIDTKVGVVSENGWIRLLSGKRTTLTALENMASRYVAATNEQINQALDAAISPFSIEPNSSQFGIFIGGTGMHLYGLGNVERMYNAYQGTKFYYGGVGNAIDFSSQDLLASGSGRGGDAILDRAVADIKRFYQPGQRIHLFGWSRGATMANKLASRIADLGMEVDFLGMYDPVDSVGAPGIDGFGSESSWRGYFGNYVTTSIPRNVNAATTIYAINEDRSFFPATKFTTSGSTKHITLKAPGAHGEIGGHFMSNMPMQQLNLKAMTEYARKHGDAFFKTSETLDPDVERIINSPVTRQIALRGIDDASIDRARFQWNNAREITHWNPYNFLKFEEVMNDTDTANWSPSGYGARIGLQDGYSEAIAAGYIGNRVKLWTGAFTSGTPPTPVNGHYLRNLDWVDKEIWDLPLHSGSPPITITQEAKDFIRSLYRKHVNGSKGGWIGEVDRNVAK